MVADPEEPLRDFLTPAGERFRRHLRLYSSRALLGGVSSSGVLAGFLDATGQRLDLYFYIGIALGVALLLLVLSGPGGRRLGRRLLVLGTRRDPVAPGRPRQLELAAVRPSAPVRQIQASRNRDPVYGAGLRVLLEASHPMVLIPSNRRDVGRDHELPLPLFADRHRRSRVDIDPGEFGIPLPQYSFERELPEGVQDTDHTLAIKDLVFVPELAACLRPGEDLPGSPIMWPEHCVDPVQLAERDLVVIGGPDTNFWHGALFEPVAREFGSPASSVPLALGLREDSGAVPSYGSRSLTVELAGLASVLSHTRQNRAELDERLYPTYGMVLACRNPFAAALGRSRWCVFVAGTRSLGTSGSVLGLVMMLRAMRQDPLVNFFSWAPSDSDQVLAPVSAILCRTTQVERSALRRDGRLMPRTVASMPLEGQDPDYSDSYIPLEVEYLSYAHPSPRWESLGRLG
jgi:hypothetical protein